MSNVKYFSHGSLAKRYGVGVKKISNMIQQGIFPEPDFEEMKLWSIACIEEWEKEHPDILQCRSDTKKNQISRLPAGPLEEKTGALQSDESLGLECRNCGCKHLPVDRTRKVKNKIIRYRHCRNCGRSKITIERIADADAEITKLNED